VRAQTFPDWELIVTEDGSDDGTRGIVEVFAASVPQKVAYTSHRSNRGLPATRNTGISSAAGEWIALLDSDDLWRPDHLAACLRTAAEGADLVHGGSILFESGTGRRLGIRAPTPAMLADFPVSLYCGRHVIQPSSVLLRRSLWEHVGGFDPHFRYVEDREMWLRCARAGARFAYSGEETCLYRKHGAALTSNAAAMAVASAEVLEKNADWEALPAGLRRRHTARAWRSAGRIVLRRDPASARRFFLKSLRHGLLAPSTLIYLLAASAFSIGRRT
jgi:GT2 family glycosyltransferase